MIIMCFQCRFRFLRLSARQVELGPSVDFLPLRWHRMMHNTMYQVYMYSATGLDDNLEFLHDLRTVMDTIMAITISLPFIG